jgi:AAA+ ATPase superfamily predicted ATPase
MFQQFVDREGELELLEDTYKQNKSSLLRETARYFAALRLYSFADIHNEFIRCISG